tara:strand:+ start:51 stop:1817 length:1767 start_codon:yes stop_codon:yes gene_type:complete
MCGLLAIMGPGKVCEDKTLDYMRDQMIHRGPDEGKNWKKQYLNGSIAMGFRRLSIIDLTANGSQPMSDQNNQYKIVFNGEIYNHIYLRNILKKKGYFFKSNTDTEVIINGFIEWGYDVLHFIEGMFSFVIWDEIEQKAFIARDRFGEKPLFWTCINKTLIFASEAKSILAHPEIQIKMNTSFINKLNGATNCSSSETIFKDVYQFPSSNLCIYDLRKGGLFFQNYWEPEFDSTKDYFFNANAIYKNKLKDLLNSSVEDICLKNSDVPVGLMLSGGIDSTLIASIIDSKDSKLETFSAIFNGYENDESNNINEFLKKTNINNFSFTPTFEDIIESFKDMHWHVENIISSPSFFLEWELCKKAKEKGYKVLITGQGSDELFSGYQEASDLVNFQRLDKVRQNELLNNFNIYNEIYNFNIIERSKKYKSIHKAYLEFDLKKLSLPSNLYFSDKTGMAHSIEIRQPYLNYKLTETAFKIPSNHLVKNNLGKNNIREIAKSYKQIPSSIISNKNKIGFEMPYKIISSNKNYMKWFKKKIESDSFKNLLPNQYIYINKVFEAKRLHSKSSVSLFFYYASLSELCEMFNRSLWTK